MEDFDDDFGDLYADVEAQASSAINCARGFHRLLTQPEGDSSGSDSDSDTDTAGNARNAAPVSIEGFGSAPSNPSSIGNHSVLGATCFEANEESYGSDSEDDLNIVLNDEDCKSKNFPLKGRGTMQNDKDDDDDDVVDDDDDDDDDDNGIVAGKEFKCVRTHGSSFPSNAKANVSSHKSVRNEREYSVCSLPKGSNSVQIARNRASFPSSMLTQSVYRSYGFSLPWYRSILDVNIDTFEEKPWRYPGVDVTDFFNFGFNEDSWKQYCNFLEQSKRHSFMQSGVSICESSKLYQVDEAGIKRDKLLQETGDEMPQVESGNLASSSRFVDCGDKLLELPKGRAIQVEDGISERQPSVDIRRPRNRDSNVVIQITVQDFNEEASDSHEKIQAPGNAKFEGKDSIDAPHPNSCKRDELSLESVEGNVGSERCSQKATVSDPMTFYPDNRGNRQSPDVDVHHLKKNSFSSEETVELSETVKYTKDGVCKSAIADRCIIETELSLGEEVELSPTLSCFASDASDTETSKDSLLFYHEKVASPKRRSSVTSGTKLQDSISSYYRNSKGTAAKTKSVETSNCSRYRHARRLEDPLKPKTKTIFDNDAFHISDGDHIYDRDCFLVNHSRQKDKALDFESSEKILAYDEESRLSRYCDGRKYAANHIHDVHRNYPYGRGNCNFHEERDPYVRANHIHDVHRNYPYGRGNCNFHEERDPYVRKNSKERVYLCEDGKRERYHCGRRNFTMDRSPLTYKKSGHLVSRIYSNTVGGMDSQFERHNKKLQVRELCNLQFLDHGCDAFIQNRYIRSVPLTEQERDILDESYERKLPYIRRELKKSGGSRYDDPSLEFDGSWSVETGDEYYRNSDNRYLSNQSDRVFYRANGGSWNDSISQGFDAFDSRLTERYRRHGRQLFPREERQNNWFDNYDDAGEIEDGTFYSTEQDNLGRRRRNWQYDEPHWAEKELTMRHHDGIMNAEKSSFFCNRSVQQGRCHAMHGSPHDAMLIDDVQANQHVFKKMRNGSNTLCSNRSSKMYRSKYEQTVLRSWNSVDLIVDEGKPSRRCPKARNLRINGWSEEDDLEIADKQKSSVNFNDSPRDKAVRHELPKDGNHYSNKKWRDKFPVTLQSEDMDIEEGQIVTEETHTTGILERSQASESQAVSHSVKKQMHSRETATNQDKVVGAYDDQWIAEMVAKMEKRRERFKEPMTMKKEEEEEKHPKAEFIVDTVETKQHRPARKRRWSGC